MTTGDKIKALRKQNDLTLSELAKRIGSSPSAVKKWEDGYIKNIKAPTLLKIAKALGTTPGALLADWEEPDYSLANNTFSIPAQKQVPILGSIACGEPILAEENIEGFAPVPASDNVDFALRCRGYSMVNARILDGDIVYIRSQPTVENGEIAAVLIDDEATLKRVYILPDRIELRPENPTFPILIFEGEERNSVRILGKAVSFLGRIA